MYALRLRHLAERDAQEITEYYKMNASLKIAKRFLKSLLAELDFIQEDPMLFQKKYRHTRVRYIKGFPYGIHYIVSEDIINVIAILHTSRDPRIARNR